GILAKIDVVSGEQAAANCTEISRLQNEIVREQLLDREAPLFGIEVTTVALQSARRTTDNGSQRYERIDRVSKVRNVGGRQGDRSGIAFETRIKIVVLASAVIDAIARANHSLVMKTSRCPGETESRIKIAIVGEEKLAALRTNTRVIGDPIGAPLHVK